MQNWSTKEFLNLKIPQNIEKLNNNEIVFQLKTIKDGKYLNQIYRMAIDCPNKMDMITEGTLPSISPNGKRIAYWKGNSLYILDLETSKTVNYGDFVQHEKVQWSPSGNKITFIAAYRYEKEPTNLPEFSTITWIDRTAFKSDDKGIYDGSYKQVYRITIEDGKVSKITQEKTDYKNAVFVSDDIVAASAVRKDSDFSDDMSICLISLTHNDKEWIKGPGGPIVEMTVSKDSRYIYFLSHSNQYWEATNFCLYELDVKKQEIKELSIPFDRSIGDYVINDIGLNRSAPVLKLEDNTNRILMLITDGYVTDIYEKEIRNNQHLIRLTNHDSLITEYIKMEKGFVYIKSQINSVAEIVYEEGGEINALWSENSTYEPIIAKEFYYEGYDGRKDVAWLFKPQSKELKGLVLNIHGGPHFCHGIGFNIDIHNLVSKGYGVVICNPAGSQGAGEELSKASYHDWGGKDYKDLINCMNAVKSDVQYSNLQWSVMGGSYGGYMVNWMIGHGNEFLCAISERSTCNRYSQAGTSDCAFRYGKFEFDGFPWENPDSYMERSPITYVKNVNTPVLLIHGENDMNCPISQSEEFYSALKLEKKEAYFARFIGQNHGFTINGEPKSRQERYDIVVWWLDRYFNK